MVTCIFWKERPKSSKFNSFRWSLKSNPLWVTLYLFFLTFYYLKFFKFYKLDTVDTEKFWFDSSSCHRFYLLPFFFSFCWLSLILIILKKMKICWSQNFLGHSAHCNYLSVFYFAASWLLSFQFYSLLQLSECWFITADQTVFESDGKGARGQRWVKVSAIVFQLFLYFEFCVQILVPPSSA